VETSLPPSVIQKIARCEGFAWTAEAVARHENPAALEHRLTRHLFSYFSPIQFRGHRVLDFGCGTGASTLSLARLLPDSAIVGLDFDEARLTLARSIASRRTEARTVSFVQSPSPSTLPAELGMFDYVVFSDALHHLLPTERRTLLPLLWKLLRPSGTLIVHHSPHSWYPIESCASGLWLLNYLPDRTAGFLARWFSSIDEEANRERDWEDLLRAGVRGTSERQILDLLPANAEVLQPVVQHSRAAYWREGVSGPGWSIAAIPASAALGWMDRRWGGRAGAVSRFSRLQAQLVAQRVNDVVHADAVSHRRVLLRVLWNIGPLPPIAKVHVEADSHHHTAPAVENGAEVGRHAAALDLIAMHNVQAGHAGPVLQVVDGVQDRVVIL